MSYEAKAKNTAVNMRRMSCPECGTAMHEAYRSNEDSGIFIWYECAKDKCCGQWLEKYSLLQKQAQKSLRISSVQL